MSQGPVWHKSRDVPGRVRSQRGCNPVSHTTQLPFIVIHSWDDISDAFDVQLPMLLCALCHAENSTESREVRHALIGLLRESLDEHAAKPRFWAIPLPQARCRCRIWEENALTDPCHRRRLTLRRDESRSRGAIWEMSDETPVRQRPSRRRLAKQSRNPQMRMVARAKRSS